MLLLSPALVMGQQSRELNIGDMYYNTNEAVQVDRIEWPWRQPWTTTGMLSNHGFTVGVKRNWTDPGGITREVQIAQVRHNKYSNSRDVTVPVRDAFKRTFRNPFPKKTIDRRDWTRAFDARDPVDASQPADAIIYTELDLWPQHGMGMKLQRWAYAFSHDQYDDFVITEYVLSNTSKEPRNGVYLGLTSQLVHTSHYPGELWGNYYGATYNKYVAGDPTADSMRVWYGWDAGNNQRGVDTRARPHSSFGNFQKAQFMAYAVLHADVSATDKRDDPFQPSKAGWSQRELSPDLNSNTPEDIYRYLSQGWDPSNPGAYAQTLDSNGKVVPEGKYRTLIPGFDRSNFDPVTEQEKSGLLSFGPYNLQPGQSIRVVVAFAGGQVPLRLLMDAGRAYKNGSTSQQPRLPLPGGLTYSDMHGKPIVENGSVIGRDGRQIVAAGQELTRAQKDAVLDLGRPIVFETASKAIRTWKGGNVASGKGSFKIPLAPASPSVELLSEPNQIRIKWGKEAEQDAKAGSIKSYRIYRDYKRPTQSALPTDTAFVLVREVPVGTNEYIDKEVVRGEQYYYYVTAVNQAGIESSTQQNRSGTTANRRDEAVSLTRPPDANWKENVVVVPNPFHASGAYTYGGRRLNFLNLPPYANVHIYTMTGERVNTLEHDKNSGDRDWERQDTFSTMEIVSGVYLYVVEELDGPRGNPTGETAIGKFVVIK